MAEIMTPMVDDQLGRMALIEAIRANTDAVNRLARHSEGQDRKLDEMRDTLGRVETRLTVIEQSDLKADVTEQDRRLKALEEAELKRTGANGVLQTLLKSPALGWLVGAVITAWAILTGRVSV